MFSANFLRPLTPHRLLPKSQAISLVPGLLPSQIRYRRVSSQHSSSCSRKAVSMRGTGKFLVGGNWKCNGTLESVRTLVDELNAASVPGDVDVVVAPTYIHLPFVLSSLKKEYQVSAQNCWVTKPGAYTGEVSAEQIKDLGASWVILGHSERRAIIKESNDFVGEKVAYALKQGLKVIACVGETLEQRESGQMYEVLHAQLLGITQSITDYEDVVVAYEPVWAIGTGKVASPQQAQEAHAFIRKWMSDNISASVAPPLRILYGGSVNDSNAAELATEDDIDGFLVGGASLKASAFSTIFHAKENAKVAA